MPAQSHVRPGGVIHVDHRAIITAEVYSRSQQGPASKPLPATRGEINRGKHEKFLILPTHLIARLWPINRFPLPPIGRKNWGGVGNIQKWFKGMAAVKA